MANVRFVLEDGRTIDAGCEEGGSLADLCDGLTTAVVSFSCRSANCGTCRVVVMEGARELEPHDDEELDLLEIFNATASQRLACSARIRPGAGLVVLRPARDDE
jgi:ferredoxin